MKTITPRSGKTLSGESKYPFIVPEQPTPRVVPPPFPSPPERYSAEAILTNALWVMDTYGWIVGERGYAEIGYCLLGAVRHSVPIWRNRAFHLTLDLLDESITQRDPRWDLSSGSEQIITTWNDRFGRTYADVRSLVVQTIATAHERQL